MHGECFARMACTSSTVELPGASIRIYCQDTEDDAVNPNLFDEDFSPAVYVLFLALLRWNGRYNCETGSVSENIDRLAR